MVKDIHVVAVSYGRNLFSEDNMERKRMELCATSVSSYHMIVFSKLSDGLKVVQTDSGLVLHPTNSKTRLHMIGDAVAIGSSLLKNRVGKWVVTSQDPFETGLVGYVLKRRHKVPLNIQEHGDFFSTDAWRKESVLNQIRFIFRKWILHRADTVRVVSARIEKTMQRIGISSEKIIRLAVRTDVYTGQGQETPADLHAEYPDASTIVLSMARFVPQKNLSLLVAAFATLHKQDANAMLILVGSGSEEQKIRDAVQAHNLGQAVVFKEWTDTPQAYMQSADIYALSSNYEGWGRVLVEAMLAGTPVVTTDVGCASEVLLDDIHGLVVPVGDEKLFSKALTTLAADEEMQNRFSHAARRDIISAHISMEAYTDAWADILEYTYKITDVPR